MGFANALRRVAGLETKQAASLSTTDEKAARIWGRMFGHGAVAAGKPVNVNTAMQLSAVWACVRLTSETVATLPLMLYRRHPDGGREVASDHPLYALLHDSPHADLTAVEFWEGVVMSLCLNGNAYAEKIRRGDGTLIALEPMQFDRVTVRRNEFGDREYRYADPIAKKLRLLAEDDVFHVRGFGNAGDVGLSPVSYARQTLGTALAADETAGKMYANAIRPNGVLQTDQVLKADQRRDLRENIIGPLVGSTNAGGVFVLEGGLKFSAISLSPKDLEMATAKRLHVEEICRWFGVPPIKIGHAAEGQTMWGSGVEQINQSWLDTGLRAYLRRIEAQIARSLIRPEDRKTLSAEFVVEGLLRADSKTRYMLYSSMSQNGIRSRNEIRELENLPRRDGGDDLTVQSNLVPLHLLGQIPPTATQQPDPEDDEGEAGPAGRRPFDETKAFDPAKHPRDANGMFRGRGGGRGRLLRLIRSALGDRRHRDDLDLGSVDGARFSAAAGRDVDCWRFGVSSEFIRHIDGRHGPKSGDRSPVRAGDLGNLSRVLSSGRVTSGGKTDRQGMQTVIVTASVKGKRYRAVLAVRPRRRALTLHTFSMAGK